MAKDAAIGGAGCGAGGGDRYAQLLEDIAGEFPGFRVVRKDRAALQKLIHYGLWAITVGRMRGYLDCYQTTIGRTVYVTPDWDDRAADERYVVMRHERVHLRQFRRYTRVGMAILYLLVPLPMGLAYFRARFEREAYEETIRAAASVFGMARVRDSGFRRHIVAQFTGPSYGWMWPFPGRVNAWYDRVLASLPAEFSRARE